MNADDELHALMNEALEVSLRGAWIRWWIRLFIGIAGITFVVIRWPHLWWIALAYAPFPIFSAVLMIRLRRKGFQRSPK